MGGDGGSIPGRADIVRTAGMRFARNLGGMGYLPNTQVQAGSERYKNLEEKQLRWTTCALTQEPLKPPLVACRLGQIYNKEPLLRRFLERKVKTLPPNLSHIHSLKDIKDLKVEIDSASGRIVCPLLKLEFDGGMKGMFFWSCGCVISEKAFKQLNRQRNRCSNCDCVYEEDSIVQLVQDQESFVKSKQKLAEKQNNTQKSKKQLIEKHLEKNKVKHLENKDLETNNLTEKDLETNNLTEKDLETKHILDNEKDKKEITEQRDHLKSSVGKKDQLDNEFVLKTNQLKDTAEKSHHLLKQFKEERVNKSPQFSKSAGVEPTEKTQLQKEVLVLVPVEKTTHQTECVKKTERFKGQLKTKSNLSHSSIDTSKIAVGLSTTEQSLLKRRKVF